MYVVCIYIYIYIEVPSRLRFQTCISTITTEMSSWELSDNGFYAQEPLSAKSDSAFLTDLKEELIILLNYDIGNYCYSLESIIPI